MKIAIHKCPGSFSDRWILYCKQNNIKYKIVNCYEPNILSQLSECAGLMWHWTQNDYRAQNFARQFVLSIENKGLKVFPNSKTCWHFDDKVGQKYLLESLNAPLVPTHIFYNKKDAIEWIQKTTFPKIFKLRGGAGSQNVKLVKNKKTAQKLVRRAFGKGFPFMDKPSSLKQRFWVLRRDKNFNAFIYLLKGFVRLIYPKEGMDMLPRQKGYVYFQDFIPENSFDDRIVVIGNKAIAIRRYTRKDDFRASGSGLIEHNPKLFNKKTIKLAFDIANNIGSQSIAFDFVYDKGKAILLEISYAFSMGAAYDNCPGYWDENLNWHKDNIDPQRYIIEDFLNNLK